MDNKDKLIINDTPKGTLNNLEYINDGRDEYDELFEAITRANNANFEEIENQLEYFKNSDIYLRAEAKKNKDYRENLDMHCEDMDKALSTMASNTRWLFATLICFVIVFIVTCVIFAGAIRNLQSDVRDHRNNWRGFQAATPSSSTSIGTTESEPIDINTPEGLRQHTQSRMEHEQFPHYDFPEEYTIQEMRTVDVLFMAMRAAARNNETELIFNGSPSGRYQMTTNVQEYLKGQGFSLTYNEELFYWIICWKENCLCLNH
jgi:hypothetical protein